MRIAGNISLAVYLLVLSAMPCKDHWALPVASDTGGTCLSVSCGDIDGDHEGDDLCSPLCGCACCSLAIEEAPITSPGCLAPVQVAVQPVRVKHFHPFLLSLDIWRPPARA